MLFGITGSSGCGKTTLAKRVAEELDITFMPTSITESAKRHGFNPVSPMSLRDRLCLQEKLLEDHVSMIAGAGRPLIVDRTPVDLIGYMLAEVDMHSHLRITDTEIVRVEEYVDLCLDVTARLYDSIYVLGQLDHYEVSDKRPADNRAYQTHTQMIMMGAMTRLYGRMNYSIVRNQDMEARVEYVHDAIVSRMDDITRERSSSLHIH